MWVEKKAIRFLTISVWLQLYCLRVSQSIWSPRACPSLVPARNTLTISQQTHPTSQTKMCGCHLYPKSLGSNPVMITFCSLSRSQSVLQGIGNERQQCGAMCSSLMAILEGCCHSHINLMASQKQVTGEPHLILVLDKKWRAIISSRCLEVLPHLISSDSSDRAYSPLWGDPAAVSQLSMTFCLHYSCDSFILRSPTKSLVTWTILPPGL